MTHTTSTDTATGADPIESAAADDPTGPTSDRMDRLSLEQALVDAEVANARVIDLTARLTEAHAEAQQLRQRVAELSVAPPASPATMLRSAAVGPIKAFARAILPLPVRQRIRRALG